MAGLIMGYWDCPFCGKKEIRGNVMNCPACGRARGDVRFYVKNAEEGETLTAEQLSSMEYVTEEEAKDFSDKPDWYCSFCNSLNKDNAAFCSNCGASREDSEKNYFDVKRRMKEQEEAERAAQPQTRQPAQRSRKPLMILLVIAAALVGLVLFLTGRTNRTEQVSDLYWYREIPVEQHTLCSESDWTLPEGAELQDQKSEFHHTEEVFDHYESRIVRTPRQVVDYYRPEYSIQDNGNGTFTKVEHQVPVYKTVYDEKTVQEPVYRTERRYQTKYYYTIWRWPQTRTVRAEGHDGEPRWPDPELKEDEREGTRLTEHYALTIRDEKGNETSYELPEEVWSTLKAGQSVTVQATRTGGDPCLLGADGKEIARLIPYRYN